MDLDQYVMLGTNINLTWCVDLNIKAKIIKFLEISGRKTFVTWSGQIFPRQYPKDTYMVLMWSEASLH